jgi:AraC-like DNA-binding protein
VRATADSRIPQGRGAGWCEIGGRFHEVKSGELLVVPPGAGHAYGADDNRPWSIHWFHAKGDLLGAFLDELGVTAERPVIRIGDNPRLLALFEEVLDVLEHGYTTMQLFYASQTLAHLLAALIREHRHAHQEHPSPRQKVAQTIAYMKQHLNRSLQLDTLAALANVSRSRYVDLFKQQTGYTPIDYFIRLRMHRACQLLDTTSMSVKTVAAELGYEDPLYFSRLFRTVNDLSPQAYRRLRKG